MGSQLSVPLGERSSLSSLEHRLSHQFEPDFDLELWMNTMQAGNPAGAKKIQKYMEVKYADYPELLPKIKKLPTRPWAVMNLPALDQMAEFDIDKQLESL